MLRFNASSPISSVKSSFSLFTRQPSAESPSWGSPALPVTQIKTANTPGRVNGALRNIVCNRVKCEVRMAHQRVHVFRKLIKACMCSVRGFARTAHPLRPTVSRRLVYLPKPSPFSPSSGRPALAVSLLLLRFNLNFAPARPKAALRFFKATREAISRGDLAHLLERASERAREREGGRDFVHVPRCVRSSLLRDNVISLPHLLHP
jgi:hypothetical protein